MTGDRDRYESSKSGRGEDEFGSSGLNSSTSGGDRIGGGTAGTGGVSSTGALENVSNEYTTGSGSGRDTEYGSTGATGDSYGSSGAGRDTYGSSGVGGSSGFGGSSDTYSRDNDLSSSGRTGEDNVCLHASFVVLLLC